MTILQEKIGIMLIEKYAQKYIRFEGGEIASKIYELKITDDEAQDILSSKLSYSEVLKKYSNSGECVPFMLMKQVIEDYLRFEMLYSEKKLDRA